ncbi:MAG: Dyp-type peroxidase, partial [Streptosporangiaceae bacterium]
MSTSLSRRQVFGLTGAGALAGAAAGAGSITGAELVKGQGALASETSAGGAVPFQGAHQAGIATPVQDRLHFAAFDVITHSRERLMRLLHEWTRAAAAMTAGRPVGDGAVGGRPLAPPDDTGEALGLPPARLTLTIGFGPTLFEKEGADRFGLRDKRPAALIDLPHFPGDNIDPARSHGDMAIQACADDPQVAVHAIRDLARIGFGVVSMRWSELGFGKTSSTTPSQQTPRNLFGFKDGTDNINGDNQTALRRHVWVGDDDGPPWMSGGSYLVVRRIRMHIETWDRSSLREQQQVFGRTKGEGAPLGKDRERDTIDLKAL